MKSTVKPSTNINRVRTKEKCSLNELAEAETKIAQLEQKCAHKDKMLSIVAHDMRSPLNALNSLLTILDDEALPEEFRFAASYLQNQLESVTGLLSDLLRWATVSDGNTGIAPKKRVNLVSILARNIELLKASALEKNIQVTNEVPAFIVANVNTDQIDVVIRNVIFNAIKFTTSGGTVKVSCLVHPELVEIMIVDTGIGMSRNQLDKIFTPDHLSTYGTSGERGFGIGLLLCKEYMEAHNGSISIDSAINKGTSVKITLPTL